MEIDRLLQEQDSAGHTHIPMTYRAEWQDGFGARGWKPDAVAADRRVIASTSYVGEKSPTCVLVHDLLDHLLSGFSLSGYRNEAMATTLHGLRNGIEIRSSFEWMTGEMLAQGNLQESLRPFLPEYLRTCLPPDIEAGVAQRNYLRDLLGTDRLASVLLEGFFRLGARGVPIAARRWRRQGLSFYRMHSMGLALQGLLEWADNYTEQNNCSLMRADVRLANKICAIYLVTDTGRVLACREEQVA